MFMVATSVDMVEEVLVEVVGLVVVGDVVGVLVYVDAVVLVAVQLCLAEVVPVERIGLQVEGGVGYMLVYVVAVVFVVEVPVPIAGKVVMQLYQRYTS